MVRVWGCVNKLNCSTLQWTVICMILLKVYTVGVFIELGTARECMWVYSLTWEHTIYFLKFIAHIRQGDSCHILLYLGAHLKTLLSFCQRQDLLCITLQYMSLACDLWGSDRYTNQRWLLSLACFLCSLTWFCEVTIWWLSVCVCVCTYIMYI